MPTGLKGEDVLKMLTDGWMVYSSFIDLLFAHPCVSGSGELKKHISLHQPNVCENKKVRKNRHATRKDYTQKAHSMGATKNNKKKKQQHQNHCLRMGSYRKRRSQ